MRRNVILDCRDSVASEISIYRTLGYILRFEPDNFLESIRSGHPVDNHILIDALISLAYFSGGEYDDLIAKLVLIMKNKLDDESTLEFIHECKTLGESLSNYEG